MTMHRSILSLMVGLCVSVAVAAGCDSGTAGGTIDRPSPVAQKDSDFKTDSSAAVSIGDPPKEAPAPTPPEPGEDGTAGMPAPKAGDTVAVFDTTQGKIVVQFLPKVAPGHVKNFIKLAQKGFYDGTKFHRAVPGFMIQGGDPNTKTGEGQPGTGGPGYSIKAEFNATHHIRGILSMARSQDPDSAGSQFFICVAEAPFLDNKYTAFGAVVSGMGAVDKIVNLPTNGESIADMNQAVIKSIKIEKWPLKK